MLAPTEVPAVPSASVITKALTVLACALPDGVSACDPSRRGLRRCWETRGKDSPAGAEETQSSTVGLTATLVGPEGTQVGTVDLSEVEGGTRVSAQVTGLPPGFHGFHLHAIGVCEPDSTSPSDPSMTGDFLSAGGQIGAGEYDNDDHPGDLLALYVNESGVGSLTAVTDAVTLAHRTDDDGTAAMVHALRDNYANIPERHA